MTNYESIYPGVTYLLDPNYHFTGYRIPINEMGGTTSIQTANQLKQVSDMLNQGMKTTEVSVINPEVFEMIPKDMFKEIYRLNKLTGAESTLHAPIIDPSGFTQEGWSEENRKAVERQFENVISRSHELNPNGNIPVTIHSSGIPGSEMIPGVKGMLTDEEREKGLKEVYGRIIAIDQESGKPINLEREKVFFPGRAPEGEIQTPEQRLKTANYSKLINEITNLAFYKKTADEILGPAYAEVAYILAKRAPTEEELKKHEGAFQNMGRAQLFLDNVETSFRKLYEQAAKFGDDETKKVLNTISDEWKEKNKLMHESAEKNPYNIPMIKTNLLDKTINILKVLEQHPPEFYKKVEDFAQQKASDTLSAVAFNSYKEFGKNSPIISIENPPYGSALSSGKDLKNLIQETRKKFADKLIQKDGLSKKEAEQAAERLIGATWDTSHISMIRKQGFGPEKITAETKEIAKYVKHVHFNDNFGSTHTDLPPGMGSVPIKDILEVLEKEKFKGKKIFEGGNFFQHFQTSPFPYTLEYSGSPLLEGGAYFNQTFGYQAPYFSERGSLNPSIHHSMYSSRFQSLPLELGGEVPGSQSRFAGTPNA